MTRLDEKNYVIMGVEGFTLTTFMKAMKSMYDTFPGFKRDNDIPIELLEFLEEHWDSIETLTFKECISEGNQEKRRALFSCVGPEKIFTAGKPELLDRQEVRKTRARWDDDDKEYVSEFEDVYELYKIDGESIGFEGKWGHRWQDIYAVRCWCTTTNREYWIMLPPGDVTKWGGELKMDALDAIASTIRIRETEPKRIYRHGDVILVELWGDHRDERLYSEPKPLTKNQYLTLMYSET